MRLLVSRRVDRFVSLSVVVATTAIVALGACSGDDDAVHTEPTDSFAVFTREAGEPDWAESLDVPYRGPFVLVEGCVFYEGPAREGGVNQIPVFPDASHAAINEQGAQGVALPDGEFIELGVEYDVDVAYSALIDRFELDPELSSCPTADETRSTLGLFIQGVEPVQE